MRFNPLGPFGCGFAALRSLRLIRKTLAFPNGNCPLQTSKKLKSVSRGLAARRGAGFSPRPGARRSRRFIVRSRKTVTDSFPLTNVFHLRRHPALLRGPASVVLPVDSIEE